MGEPRIDGMRNDFDDDYQVIRLRVSWGALSVVAFVSILSLQMFGDRLGISLAQMIGGTLALSVAGFALGVIGLRFGRSRGAARAGLFLNGVVLACVFIILPVAHQILRRLG